jgi:hypothetical protein
LSRELGHNRRRLAHEITSLLLIGAAHSRVVASSLRAQDSDDMLAKDFIATPYCSQIKE